MDGDTDRLVDDHDVVVGVEDRQPNGWGGLGHPAEFGQPHLEQLPGPHPGGLRAGHPVQESVTAVDDGGRCRPRQAEQPGHGRVQAHLVQAVRHW
jgi:hypothetical protein